LPSVNRLYTDLRRRGLEVLLINFREDPDLVKRTVQERGYVAPVLLWGPPTMYFLDRQGRLVGRSFGSHDWDRPEARRFVEALLPAKP